MSAEWFALLAQALYFVGWRMVTLHQSAYTVAFQGVN